MNRLEQHKMVLDKIHPSGGEIWFCPSCGRTLLVTWKPKFTQVVLEPGNEFAAHSGRDGNGLSRPVHVMLKDDDTPEADPDTFSEHTRLAPFVKWMEETGFENLWK